MKEELIKKADHYFRYERLESLVFIFIGMVTMAAGLSFLMNFDNDILTGAAYPLVIIAPIQLTVGFTIFWRSPKDFIRVQDWVNNSPEKIRAEELPRMEKVNKNFDMFRYIEMGLLTAGIILFLIYRDKSMLIFGVANGLVIQSGLMLIADYFAERRADKYTDALLAFRA